MIAIADKVEDLDLDSLPESFIMKSSHGSGRNVIVKSRATTNMAAVCARMSGYLGETYGRLKNEWWYADIKPRVVVESLLEDGIWWPPADFRLYVFHGKVQFVCVDTGRGSVDPRRSYFDTDWKRLPFTKRHKPIPSFDRPESLEEMIAVAEALAVDWGFVRVDLYCINGRKVLFGEMTFAPGSGRHSFEPSSYGAVVGSLWRIDQGRQRPSPLTLPATSVAG